MTKHKTKRPLGISIISGMYIFTGGILCVILIFTQLSDKSAFQMVIPYLGLIVTLLIGFGLSLGKKWSWWLASILLSYALMIGVYELINLKSLLSEMNLNEYGFKKEAYKSFGLTFVQLVVLIYLFQKNVFAYFDFEYKTLLNKIIIVNTISPILFAINYVVSKNL